MIVKLSKIDVDNIVAMIEFQERLVDKDACHILNETDKVHALLYLENLKEQFLKAGK